MLDISSIFGLWAGGAVLIFIWTLTMDEDIAGFVFFLLLIIYSSIIGVNTTDEVYFDKFKETKVHSTAMNYNSIQGSFFLGSGYINSKEMYSANYLQDDGAYVRFYIPVASTKRYPKEHLKDYAIYRQPICKIKPTWLFSDDSEDVCPPSKKMGEIFVPINTIVKQLNFQ